MAEHIDRNTAREHSHENKSLSSVQSRNTNPRPSDDVIVTLANSTENRRARQVNEWERMRRQVFPSAS